MDKETDPLTVTLSREDWDLIVGALRGCSLDNLEQARKVGLESTYGALLIDRATHMQALANDLDMRTE